MKNIKGANLFAYSLIFFSLLLFVPPILFTWQFGLGVFPKLEQWAHLGSFFSGVYTPLIGFLTLIVLFIQLRILNEQTKIQDKQAARDIDIARIEESKSEFEYHILRISSYLQEHNQLADDLIRNKEHIKLIVLKGHTKLYASYMILVTNLAGLRLEKGSNYSKACTGCELYAISHLGYDLVNSIDKVMIEIQLDMQKGNAESVHSILKNSKVE